jgi:hypothetical protein
VAGSSGTRGLHVGGYKPSGFQCGVQRGGWRGAAQPIPGQIATTLRRACAHVAWPRVAEHMGSLRSFAATMACGLVCAGKPPLGFKGWPSSAR